jgi:hypothetical protein
VGATLHRARAQASRAISARVEDFSRVARTIGMEQTALFHREEEDEPVDQPQELVEVVLGLKRAVLEIGTQRLVLRMGEEAVTKRDERFLDAAPQVLASARALFPTRVAPNFEGTLGGRLAFSTEPRLVAEEPKRSKVGVSLLDEDALEVGFDPRGAREARVVAHDAQRGAVGGDAPERAFLRIQVLLRKAEGAALAAPRTEAQR